MAESGVAINGNQEEDVVGWLPSDDRFGTKAIHAGFRPTDQKYAPLVPPIFTSTTFEQEEPGKLRGNIQMTKGFEYLRCGSPTRKVLEDTLAALDGGKYALCYTSGQAAALNLLSTLKTGEHIVCSNDVYGGIGRLFVGMKASAGINTEFVDLEGDLTELKAALKPSTKLVWFETPTNPTMKVVDIAKVAQIVHDYSKDIIVAVDNTFLTPFFQRPLVLGVDVVVYSLTKYMNGHTDVLMGALVTSDEELYKRLTFAHYTLGAVPSPFDCYLVIRGLKTLHVRMPLHMKNSLAVARFLQKHPKVSSVLHPGLSSHPGHDLAQKQSGGHSGIVAFYLRPEYNPLDFLKKLKIFSLAVSLGGVESLVAIPAIMIHPDLSAEVRAELGITDNLIRFSVGLEAEADLIQDMDQALSSC